MTIERISDQEFRNVLDVAGRSDLPSSARALITELFLRVQDLERRTLAQKSDLLQQIIHGMDGDLQQLGSSPDKANLRDRVASVTTAVRDLTRAISEASTDNETS